MFTGHTDIKLPTFLTDIWTRSKMKEKFNFVCNVKENVVYEAEQPFWPLNYIVPFFQQII